MNDASRDRDIRRSLQEWLLARYADSPGTAIIHELDIPRPSGRIDVALINGRMQGYEIKSSVDTLTRLGNQAGAFSAVFETMTLVITRRHSKGFARFVPDWWGILEVKDGQFRMVRRGRQNPTLNLESVLYLLTNEELRTLRAELGLMSPSKLKKDKIVGEILGTRRRVKILELTREALKCRAVRPITELAA